MMYRGASITICPTSKPYILIWADRQNLTASHIHFLGSARRPYQYGVIIMNNYDIYVDVLTDRNNKDELEETVVSIAQANHMEVNNSSVYVKDITDDDVLAEAKREYPDDYADSDALLTVCINVDTQDGISTVQAMFTNLSEWCFETRSVRVDRGD